MLTFFLINGALRYGVALLQEDVRSRVPNTIHQIVKAQENYRA
jgi:hypothetical protein